MQDKRLTHRLTEYWNQLRGSHPLPQWDKFDSSSFSDIWRNCCGWKVNAANTSTIVYTYEYVGDSVKQVAGEDRTGKTFTSLLNVPGAKLKASGAAPPEELIASHFHNFPAARILQKIDRVVKKPAIVIEEGRVTDGKGQNIRFRSCLLPFGTEEGVVTHMVLGLSWKAY